MSLIKWEPFGDVSRYLEDFSPLSFARVGLDLAVDLFERDGKLIAKMNLPGVKPDDVSVSVENNTLRIDGSRSEEKETDEGNYYSKEIRRGSFSRSMVLPKRVETGKVEATYGDGVLEVAMPIISGESAGKIKVKAKG